jgi:hypothetical protein
MIFIVFPNFPKHKQDVTHSNMYKCMYEAYIPSRHANPDSNSHSEIWDLVSVLGGVGVTLEVELVD